MMPIPRVVLDTVVFVQSLISGRGTAAGCIDRLKAGRFVLLVSPSTLREMREVPLRPELVRRYPHITPDRVEAFAREIETLAVQVREVPKVLALPRDPKDEMFLDLAVAGGAGFLVTWNARHLTYLMNRDTPEGIEFCTRFPALKIVSPAVFLAEIDEVRAT
jgi:putative PIN family toxin of toxin-antitoxin system